MVKIAIDYNEIDEKCRNIVRFFNDIGLVTKFSCQGHDRSFRNVFDVIFDECVLDDDIFNFLLKFDNKYSHTPFVGKFVKWMRKINGGIVSNWIYEVDYGDCKLNQRFADTDLAEMKKMFNKI